MFFVRKSIPAFCVLLLVLILSACSSTTTFRQPPVVGQTLGKGGAPIQGMHAHLLALDVQNGKERSQANGILAELLRRRLTDSGMFEQVRTEPALLLGQPVTGKMEALAPHVVEMRGLVSNKADAHLGGTFGKGFAIGATFYLLAPVISYTADFDTEISVDVVRWDGARKTYHGVGETRTRYKHFANKSKAFQEGAGKALDGAIDALLAQIVADRAFFEGTVQTAKAAP